MGNHLVNHNYTNVYQTEAENHFPLVANNESLYIHPTTYNLCNTEVTCSHEGQFYVTAGFEHRIYNC